MALNALEITLKQNVCIYFTSVKDNCKKNTPVEKLTGKSHKGKIKGTLI